MAHLHGISVTVARIRCDVEQYGGDGDAAVKALILAVPLKKSVAPTKEEMRESLAQQRGEDEDDEYIKDVVRDGKAGAFIRASDLAQYNLFEGDSIIIIGGNRFSGFEMLGDVLYLREEDLILEDAQAVDMNLEGVSIAKAAKAITQVYGSGVESKDPYFENTSSPRRRFNPQLKSKLSR